VLDQIHLVGLGMEEVLTSVPAYCLLAVVGHMPPPLAEVKKIHGLGEEMCHNRNFQVVAFVVMVDDQVDREEVGARVCCIADDALLVAPCYGLGLKICCFPAVSRIS
jgi:hypothetical protein